MIHAVSHHDHNELERIKDSRRWQQIISFVSESASKLSRSGFRTIRGLCCERRLCRKCGAKWSVDPSTAKRLCLQQIRQRAVGNGRCAPTSHYELCRKFRAPFRWRVCTKPSVLHKSASRREALFRRCAHSTAIDAVGLQLPQRCASPLVREAINSS